MHMDLKDYYKILDLDHSADAREIKKAFRRQAMKFHPDKNEGDQLAESHFKEVQEAYEVLSDPRRRSTYNQQRWYRKNSRNFPDESPVTPYSILHKCIALNRYISRLDPMHLNYNALNHYIVQLLSALNLQTLISRNDRSYITEIINELLKSAGPLQFKSFENICMLLLQLAGDDDGVIAKINRHIREKKIADRWNTYRPFLVLLISLLLCLFIYLFSK